jgi:CTP-dependent riboflavin kinase
MLEGGCITKESVAREEILKYKLDKMEDQKELYCRQRAKAHWLQHGDRNTRFFHEHTSERRRLNKIRRLLKDDGSVVEEMGEIHTMVTNFYKSLFQSHAGNRYDELLSQVPHRVTDDMNEALHREYNTEEIKAALDDMGDLKAPGQMVCLHFL